MSRSIAAAFMLKARRAVLRALLGAMSLSSITTAVASVMLSACSTNDYLQQSEETYGVTDAWYRGDRRKFHHVLLAPNQLSLFDPGYIIGVEEVHPSDSSFVPSGSERYAHQAITHVMLYPAPAATGCAIFSLLEPSHIDPDPTHNVFTHCPTSESGAGAAPVPLPQKAKERDACSPDDYGPLDQSVSWTADKTQGEAIFRFRQSLCSELARGQYTDIVVVVMGWNTDQRFAYDNFNALLSNLKNASAARDDAARTAFRPLVVGITWPSEYDLGPLSPFPLTFLHLASFYSKKKYAEDLGTNVISDLTTNILIARRDAGVRAQEGGAKHDEPNLIMIGHSFGARALVEALTAPLTGSSRTSATAAPGSHRRRDEARARYGDRFRDGDRLFLLQGAVEISELFSGQELAGILGDGAPRTIMTASDLDTANKLAFWGYYLGAVSTFREVCLDPAHAERWQSTTGHRDYDLRKIGCGTVPPNPRPDCARGGPSPQSDGAMDRGATAGYRFLREAKGHPIQYYDATSIINCDEVFTGGGAHSDIFQRKMGDFLFEKMVNIDGPEKDNPESTGFVLFPGGAVAGSR